MKTFMMWVMILLAIWCHVIIDADHNVKIKILYRSGRLYIDDVMWTCSMLLPIEIMYVFDIPGWVILLTAFVNSVIRGIVDSRYMKKSIDLRTMKIVHIGQISVTYAFILSVVPAPAVLQI